MHPRGQTKHAFMVAMLALFGLAATNVGHAHPHVWVTMETEILYNPEKAITGFRHKWSFDKLYATFAIQGLDKNGDGKYSREELQELAQVNIDDLKMFKYYTFPRITDVIAEQQAPKDYYLEYTDGILTLYLTIPLVTPIDASKMKDFILTISDPAFYIDFAFAKGTPVRLTSAPQGCSPVIKNPDASQASVRSLGEAYFEDANASAKLAAQYAKSITITCPDR
jgi:ABC-type uncharacterized transport system substrate-binding protein